MTPELAQKLFAAGLFDEVNTDNRESNQKWIKMVNQAFRDGLEEAARIAEEIDDPFVFRSPIAAAIRAAKDKP